MSLKQLDKFETYKKIYHFVGSGAKTRAELQDYLLEEMQDNTKVTVYKHVEKAFSGELPILKVVDDRVSIDEVKLRGIAEELFKLCGTDAWKIFSGPAPAPKGKNAEVDIAKVTSVESPVVRDLKKRVGELEAELAQAKATYEEVIRTKDEELKKAVDAWQKKLEQLKVKRAKKACEDIAAEMERKVIVTESIRSVEPEHLARDFFLDDSHWQIDVPYQISRFGGERDSLYAVIDETTEKLEVKSYVSDVFARLMKCPLFKRRMEDESHLAVVDEGTISEERAQYLKRREITGEEIYKNRLISINNMLTNPNLSNQMKLAYYAAMTEYHGKEMSDLLNYAGDLCVDVVEVIKLLENPMEHYNYHNVRGFLRQAAKPSQARIKRETVRELISGEWYVEAEYNGKMCRFQMLPVDELIAFKEALKSAKYDDAIIELQSLIATKRIAQFEGKNPDNKIVVKNESEKSKDKKYEEALGGAMERMRHVEKESGVDVHVHIEEGDFNDGFKEAKSDGREK